MSDLWTEASRNVEAEHQQRRLVAARHAVVPKVWSFLAQATTPTDYTNRKALVSDKIDHAIAGLAEGVDFAVLRAEVEASLDADFDVLRRAQQEVEHSARMHDRHCSVHTHHTGGAVTAGSAALYQQAGPGPSTDVERGNPDYWRVEFIVSDGSPEDWYSNSVVYPSQAIAEEAGQSKADSWFSVTDWRVVTDDTPMKQHKSDTGPGKWGKVGSKQAGSGDRYKVVQDPLNGNKFQVKKFYPDQDLWHDVGDACDTQAEADAKMDREKTGSKTAAGSGWDALKPGDKIRVAWEEHAHEGTFVRLESNSNSEFYGDAPLVIYTREGNDKEQQFVPARTESPRMAAKTAGEEDGNSFPDGKQEVCSICNASIEQVDGKWKHRDAEGISESSGHQAIPKTSAKVASWWDRYVTGARVGDGPQNDDERCPTCWGKGWVDGGAEMDFMPANPDCPDCGGTGIKKGAAKEATQVTSAKPGARTAGEGAYITQAHDSTIKHDVPAGAVATAQQGYQTWTGQRIYDWSVEGFDGDGWQLGGSWTEQASEATTAAFSINAALDQMLAGENPFPPKKDEAPSTDGEQGKAPHTDGNPDDPPKEQTPEEEQGDLDPTSMQPATPITLAYTLTGTAPGEPGEVPATFESFDGTTAFFTYEKGRFGVTNQGGKWVDAAGTEFTFKGDPNAANAQQENTPAQGQNPMGAQPVQPQQQPVASRSRHPFGDRTAGWQDTLRAIDEGLRNAKTLDEVLAFCPKIPDVSVGDGFYEGDGDSLADALSEAGWSYAWSNAPYHFAMRPAGGGEGFRYVEGDIYKGVGQQSTGSRRTANLLDAARQVMDTKGFVTIDENGNVVATQWSGDDLKPGSGIVLDLQTANLITTLLPSLNEGNQAKILAMPAAQAVDVLWRLYSKVKASKTGVEMTRTRVSIPTQLREAGHTLEARTGDDGRLVYTVDGEEMDLKEAADRFLGGWDNAFGKGGSKTAAQVVYCPSCGSEPYSPMDVGDACEACGHRVTQDDLDDSNTLQEKEAISDKALEQVQDRSRENLNRLTEADEDRLRTLNDMLQGDEGLTQAQREEYDHLSGQKSGSKTAMPNPTDLGVNIGDVFYSSWGYDQTNVDFYEVVGLSPASIKVRAIGQSVVSSDQYGQDMVVPVPGSYRGETMTKRIQTGFEGKPAFTVNSYSSAWFWNGEPKRQTSSGWGH